MNLLFSCFCCRFGAIKSLKEDGKKVESQRYQMELLRSRCEKNEETIESLKGIIAKQQRCLRNQEAQLREKNFYISTLGRDAASNNQRTSKKKISFDGLPPIDMKIAPNMELYAPYMELSAPNMELSSDEETRKSSGLTSHDEDVVERKVDEHRGMATNYVFEMTDQKVPVKPAAVENPRKSLRDAKMKREAEEALKLLNLRKKKDSKIPVRTWRI